MMVVCVLALKHYGKAMLRSLEWRQDDIQALKFNEESWTRPGGRNETALGVCTENVDRCGEEGECLSHVVAHSHRHSHFIGLSSRDAGLHAGRYNRSS